MTVTLSTVAFPPAAPVTTVPPVNPLKAGGKFLYDAFLSPHVTPAQVRTNIGLASGIGLIFGLFGSESPWQGIKNLFTTWDGLLNIAGLACLIPGMQWLMIPVAACYLAKSVSSFVSALGCLWNMDLGGFAMNLGAAALTAVCAIPMGKVLKLGNAFKALKAGEITGKQFAGSTIQYLYGREARQQIFGFLADPKKAGKNVLPFLERLRDGLYKFFRPSYIPPSVRNAASGTFSYVI